MAMVLAVNWPGHEPTVGAHARSSSPSSVSVMVPASTEPTRLIGGKHGHVAPAPAAGQHGAAVNEHARAVEAHHRHHDAGQGLVAAGKADQRVVGVAAHDGLDGIGNELARDEAQPHALVVHRHAVGDRDGRERHRHPAAGRHAQPSGIGLGAERHRAGRVLALRADDADPRLVEILLVQAAGAQEGTVRRAVETIGGDARAALTYCTHDRQSQANRACTVSNSARWLYQPAGHPGSLIQLLHQHVGRRGQSGERNFWISSK